MKNCLIVDGGSVTGLRASGVTYMFSEPISQEVLKRGGKAFITAFEENPIKALQDIEVEIEGLPKNISVKFEEEQSEGYIERTKKNASADATLDFAFGSEGEPWTKKAVVNQNKKHIGTNLKSLEITPQLVNNFVNQLNSVNAKTLNIAGQGIYNIENYTQGQIDNFVYELLNKVLNSPNLKTKIVSIRTGGQTGFDEAGTKAGIKLGLPTLTLAPKNWVFRIKANNNKGYEDIYNEKQFKGRFDTNTTNKSKGEFIGYKGGYSNEGKGSPEGDGKDKAMREVADAAIVELANNKPSSSRTTINILGKPNGDSSFKIMLARNGELNGNILKEETKKEIKKAHENGSSFVVGDMPGVDTQFIEYLIEIGAKFEVYHTGNKSRINVESMMNNRQIQNTIKDTNYSKFDTETNPLQEYYNLVIKDFENQLSYLQNSLPKNLEVLRYKILNENQDRWFKEAEKNNEDLYISSDEEILNKMKEDKSISKEIIKEFENLYKKDLKLRQEVAKFNAEVLDVYLNFSSELKDKVRKNKIYEAKAVGEKYTVDELKDIITKVENYINNQQVQNTIKDTSYSKFDTETNPTQDFKDLIQSLSDKLGIPVRYDNNLPYAGAFIDGNVVLNPSKMDETTVWHEFAHPFVQAVRKQNKPLYDNLVNEIYNTPHGKALLADVQKLYSDKSKKIQEEEVIVELIARYASGKIDGFTAKKYKSIWDKVKDFIRSIGKMIFKEKASPIATQMNPLWNESNATPIFAILPNATIKDIASLMKNGGKVWRYSQQEYEMRVDVKDKNWYNKRHLLDSLDSIKEYKKYISDSESGKGKKLSEEDVIKYKELIGLFENEVLKNKGKANLHIRKENQYLVSDFGGVFHNIGAFMNKAGIKTVKEALDNTIQLLSEGNKIDLATWNNKGLAFKGGKISISFKDNAFVKQSYKENANTDILEGSYERFSRRKNENGMFELNPFIQSNKEDYAETVMTASKDNIKELILLNEISEEEMTSLKQLSDITGAPIIDKATNETIYTPENKVEYQPEIYESRFNNKNLKVESLKSILSDYGTSYDSFSPQLKSQIKTKLTNNPELLNDSNFIKSLTC